MPKFDLKLVPDAKKILDKKKKAPFPMRGDYRDLLVKCLNEMAEAGVGMLNGPDVYHVSPCFFTKRPRSPKLRLCCAYNDINDVTVDEIFPLPSMEHIIGAMRNKKYFSVIDLKAGFWQCGMTERAQQYLAMTTPVGIFKWGVLPFGPKGGPAYFQRTMEETLKKGLGKYCLVYIDDIVIFSDTFDEHLAHLDNVLSMLKACNFKCNYEKCHFALKQIKLLGKILTGDGVITDPALVNETSGLSQH